MTTIAIIKAAAIVFVADWTIIGIAALAFWWHDRARRHSNLPEARVRR